MFEYQTRDIGGDICYYKRKNGTQLWSFINEKEYKKVNTGDMETIEYKDGGKLMEGREILYKDENVALQHNKVSDNYSVINPNTGAFMEKGGEINKMRKIRVKKSWSDKYMPSVKHIYYDKSNNKYYFLDFENDVMELRNEYTLGAFAEYLKENDIKLAKGGSLKRSNNSPMLRYVNFEDGWHINLTKLTSSMNQNGKPYKGNNKYGISRVGGEQGQEVWEFETLNEADTKFNELVELGKTYSKIEKQGEAKGNYAEGGEINTKVDALKKGDTISIEFGSSFSKDNKVTLKVRSRNKVRKGKIDKITFENAENPNTVKYYAYERGDGVWRFAKGDSAISNINIVDSYAEGGEINSEDMEYLRTHLEEEYELEEDANFESYDNGAYIEVYMPLGDRLDLRKREVFDFDESKYVNIQQSPRGEWSVVDLSHFKQVENQNSKEQAIEWARNKGLIVQDVQPYNSFAEGGEITEINEDGSNLPQPLYELFGELDEDEDPYKEMERLRLKAHKLGYDFDYDLSGGATTFWKTNKMAKGGSIGSSWFSGELSFLNW